MEGMLCRWALAMQEYDFKIVYHKGALDINADALSRIPTFHCATTIATPHYSVSNLHASQQDDNYIPSSTSSQKVQLSPN